MSQPTGSPFPGRAVTAQILSHPAVAAVVEPIEEYLATHNMNDVLTQDDFFDGLAELLERAGTVFTDLGDSWSSDTPLDKQVVDFMHDLGADLTAMAGTGRDLYKQWSQAHEYDLERARNPRAGEEKLDVQAPGV